MDRADSRADGGDSCASCTGGKVLAEKYDAVVASSAAAASGNAASKPARASHPYGVAIKATPWMLGFVDLQIVPVASRRVLTGIEKPCQGWLDSTT